MPAGWLAVPRDGSAAVDDSGLALGAPDSVLERRAEHTRLSAELDRAEAELGELRTTAASAESAAERARAAFNAARSEEGRLVAERRRAEELERAALREHEAVAREAAWHEAQVARLDGELARLREATAEEPPPGGETAVDAPREGDRAAMTAWESRAGELRERRDRLAARLATHDSTRRDAEHARARAEAAVANAEERIARADRESATLAERETMIRTELDGLRSDIAAATTRERAAREALRALHAADAADRSRLTEAERAASAARERLRTADDRARSADHAEVEARLGLESLRESVLVELAGLGDLGLTSLGMTPPTEPATDEEQPDDTSALETALAALADRWAVDAPTEPPPSPGRLAQLRRRYHELGAANPYAVEEYAELKARLESLETQGDDLRSAITKTRELIAELDTMIATQFRTTFAALETAFERRFEQLFDGGFAKLSLTDPSDLGSTGVEIVARPPGKKPQALAMLSGGERALTAVALLFAMLEVRPVPFCVLDEVDAALDEANIGRFAEALRSLADGTQFIVITHNRGTIESADALYGVTVGDDSVSRVISLRLDEAQALASDRRRELSAAG
jgi:chromosome segregation protein